MTRKKTATVSPTPAVLGQNLLLRHLTSPDRQTLLETGKVVRLELREKVYDANTPINHVYFPLTCVLSVVAEMQDGGMIEVGTVGYEGVSALPLILGATTSANHSYCQVPGEAVMIPSRLFARLMEENLDFRKRLDRYLQAYINLLGQLAACNRLHSLYERCARWILLTHDRVRSQQVHLTQEFLGMMLGSRRSGVTIAASTLKAAGFITYAHGIITILDRPGLEDAACECYSLAQKQFGLLI
ncbi:MAG TPA: Crp/Fnr family transcriptional regulator [Candidatus Baltobacteraceae bacterium]|jgi:CRP-like cAMP-binding protein|nr:Crp/Fnr family transcriptional regulator [Candidatus Baltobacteraceae bacterium]